MNQALLSPAYRRRFIAVLFFVCLFNLGDRAVFSVVVFVKGLSLPFPVCPDFIESCPIR